MPGEVVCPPEGSPEWKRLASKLGSLLAKIAFFRNGNKIPTPEKAAELGVRSEAEGPPVAGTTPPKAPPPAAPPPGAKPGTEPGGPSKPTQQASIIHQTFGWADGNKSMPTEASDAKAGSYLKSLKLPVIQDPAFGGWRFEGDGFNYDTEGLALADHLGKITAGQYQPGADMAYVASLNNALTINFNVGKLNDVFSLPVRSKIFQVFASERSFRGQQLRALLSTPEDLRGISHNVDVFLERVYADAFGGDAYDKFLARIVAEFRGFFTDTELEDVQKSYPKLVETFNRIRALNRADEGGRVYRRVQSLLKPKSAKKLSKLEADAKVEEAVRDILEKAAKMGIEPRPSRTKPLTAMQKLLMMVTPKNSAKISALIEQAVKDAEHNAGVKAQLNAALDQSEREDWEARFQAGEEPSDEMIQRGLQLPEFAHWGVIKDDILGYSPTTMKLVEDVIRGDFNGIRKESRPTAAVDTRINLAELAKQPDNEVERVLNAYYDRIKQSVALAGAKPATISRIEARVARELVTQLNSVRQRLREPMFAPPKDPATALSKDQKMAQMINAKLFEDPRLNIQEMVERVASKPTVRALMPTLTTLIKQVFETPLYRQDDLRKNFLELMKLKFGIEDDEAEGFDKVFDQAFTTKIGEAKKRAFERARKSLGPREVEVFGSSTPLWTKLEKAVNAGLFNSGDVLHDIAAQRGWKPPSDETIAKIKAMALEEQKLRELSPEEMDKLRRDNPDITHFTHEDIEKRRAEKEKATTYARSELLRKMGVEWARITRPINIPGLTKDSWLQWWHTRENLAAAINEYETLDMIFKVGFVAFRLPIHITTQLLWHIPSRSVARALLQRQSDLARGNNTQFVADVSSALIDSAKATAASLKSAMIAARAEIAGRGEARNVDRLLSGINAMERLATKAAELHAQGDHVRAVLLQVLNAPRFIAWFISAVDHFQGIPTEYQDIINRIELKMREDGRSKAEIDSFKDRVFNMMKSEIVTAAADARSYLEAAGSNPTQAQVEEAAVNLVRRRIYDQIAALGLPADEFEADINILRSTVSWQERTTRGAGMIIAGPMRAMSRGMEWAGLPLSFARLSNAIATGINYSLMNTPLYRLADTGPRGEHSTWFRTEFDRKQRAAQALFGSIYGSILMALVAAGVITVRMRWPRDPKKREALMMAGHKIGTAEFNLPNGEFIPISLTVGPLSLAAPYLAFAGAIQQLVSDRSSQQANLAAEAERKGLPVGQIRPVGAGDILELGLESALGTIMGNRTASGLAASAMEYGVPNSRKAVSAYISPMIPGLPAYQEISRAMGVNLDPKLATVWDYMVPLPTSGAQMVNALGDPVRTPNDIQRIVQAFEGGTYPFPVDPRESAETSSSYQALFNSGWMPPTIAPGKGYNFNGTFRPMNDQELQAYTLARGQNLKAELAQLGPDATREQVKQAYGKANRAALQGVGATVSEAGATPTPSRSPEGVSGASTVPGRAAGGQSRPRAAGLRGRARGAARRARAPLGRNASGFRSRLRLRRPTPRGGHLRPPRARRLRLGRPSLRQSQGF